MKEKLQANISGYLGKAVSLFAILDTDTGVLNIQKKSKNFQNRNEDFVLITNIPRVDNDFYVDQTMLLDSIESYYRMKNGFSYDNVTPLLNIGNQVGGADPSSGIEINGVNTSGMDYRIAPDIQNIQVAVLAMCLYAERLNVVNDTLEMFGELNSLYTRAFTI